MMLIERAKALFLPDGSYIKAEAHGGDVGASEEDPRGWKSLDISLIRPSGKEEVLCALDYEDQAGLRVLVFGEGEEPEYVKRVELEEADEGEDIPLF